MEPSAATILVVDDEDFVRHLLIRSLGTQDGYRYLEAGDGEQARQVLEDEPVDVVITDVLMPRMTGLELMRWAKEHCPGPIWIINSGFESFDAAVEAVSLGAFAFLSKEVQALQAVQTMVRNAVETLRLRREREQLSRELEERNARLDRHVEQLQELCRMLVYQTEVVEDDLRRAERIHRALLPRRAPRLPGARVSAMYRPSEHVGGDLYDLVPLPDGRMVVYVADATGHGVSAAMLCVLFKNHLNPTGDPAADLLGVNRAIHAEVAGQGLFLTAAYVVMDPARGQVLVAGAGHPPVALIRADGSISLIESTGPAIGLVSDSTWEARAVELGPGDRLLLLTDGALDAMDATDAARTVTPLDDDRGLASLMSRASPDDDVTLVILRLEEGPSRLQILPRPERHHAPARSAELVRGTVGDTTVLGLHGRCTLTLASPLDREGRAAIGHGSLAVGLGSCSHLDSTMLGTLHELVRQAAVAGRHISLYGVHPEVEALFRELGMARVLGAVTPVGLPEPPDSRPVPLSGRLERDRVLRAHMALSELTPENREAFREVVEALRRDD